MDSIQTKTGYIYAIENNFDTSVYVGLTIKTIKERFAQHLQAARSNRASCILHLFMAKHGPDNFFIRELRKVEYHSIIELQLVEQECIRDFGNLNTVYNSRSYEMGGLTLERIIQERKPKEKPVCVSKVPPKEDVMEIACEAEEVPNKKISLDKFIGLFIPEEENFGHILNDLTVKGNIHVSSRVLEWFGYGI
jgi:GIY-YIG catalytic domain